MSLMRGESASFGVTRRVAVISPQEPKMAATSLGVVPGRRLATSTTLAEEEAPFMERSAVVLPRGRAEDEGGDVASRRAFWVIGGMLRRGAVGLTSRRAEREPES